MKYRAGTSLFTTTINTATSWSYIYICSQRGGQVAPQYERKNEEEAAALGQPSGWRWRKDAEVWLPCEHYLDVDLVKKWMTTRIVCCTTKKAKRQSRGDGDRWEIDEGIKEGSISAPLFPNGSLSRWPMDFRTTPTSPFFCWIGEWVYPPRG